MKNTIKLSAIIFVCALMFTACGGGGGGTEVVQVLPTPHISVSPSSLDFAGVVLDNSVDRTVEIQSTGNANLSIGQISTSNPTFSTDTCSNVTLAPSQKCSLRVRFAPTTQGTFTGTLSIPSNDPGASTVNISLSGIGYGLNVWINKVNSISCASVSVDVTVTDPKSSIPLSPAPVFTLSQNGQPQSITATNFVYPSPVTLVLALDSSGSMLNILPQIRDAAKSFINQLSLSTGINANYVAICKYTEVIKFYPQTAPLFIAADTGKSQLYAAIDDDFGPGHGTGLYDAVSQSIERLAQPQGTYPPKHAVVVLSDGADEGSGITLDQVIAYANQNGIPVFTIYYAEPTLDFGKPEIMQRLASETGGQYYNAPTTADFAAIFQQISNVLTNKYTLDYTPSTCSGTVTLNVQAKWNNGSIDLTGQNSRTVSFP